MVLKVTNAGFHYSNSEWLFRNLSFQVREGELCAILGPNGCGKSTLLKALLHVQPLIEGQIKGPERIGHVPQQLEIPFDFKVIDMVLMGRVSHLGTFATPTKKDYEVAVKALNEIGMAYFSDRIFKSLSGGERQLVLIARAIAGESDLILLDEPTASLDLANEIKVLNVLQKLKKNGVTILMTTHDPEHAFHIAETVLLIKPIGNCQFGLAKEILTDSILSELYNVPIRSIKVVSPEESVTVLIKYDGIRERMR
ncbi:MAG: ABC transporter ATP-binding protein [Methylophaga sp.]|nr:MAG: ABC transporter ATP-binding protein [Methylophaga sp.]